MKTRLWRFLPIILVTIGLAFSGQGLYIYAKAQLAQVLLQRAWVRSCRSGETTKPWPWADTCPMARLYLPKQDLDCIVLTGSSGRTMAFGPGHLSGSALPCSKGNCVVTAHRDTHFRALKNLDRNDRIILENTRGKRMTYVVKAIFVVDKEQTEVLQDTQEYTLTLITCYPFNAVVPGGPQRYVIQAIAAP